MAERLAATHPRIAVLGLWHLGCVSAACLADPQWPVLALDPDPAVIAGLREDVPPLFEPGLTELIAVRRAAGLLAFAQFDEPAMREAEVIWITFDTPVDDEDVADVESVLAAAAGALRNAADGALVISSSQLPVGSVAGLARRMADAGRDDLRFACVPENLRLGRAIEAFTAPDRIVAGVGNGEDRAQLEPILARFSERIEWMSVESAEMTKHALNAFLATSVAFINEVATICEQVGADGAEVARGLKSEPRIGPRAYLSPGDAFAGGTLARDIIFLNELAEREGVRASLVAGVRQSNLAHRDWARHTLEAVFDGQLNERRIAIWGLTYKPGTDTLRRSSALALCDWLTDAGASVVAYDPAISALPASHSHTALATDPLSAARGAEALVVSTPWPEFRELAAEPLIDAMARPVVIDAAGHLAQTLGADPTATYLRVGALRT